MYTQHPILTEKHRIVDIFADLLKRKTEISHGPGGGGGGGGAVHTALFKTKN